MKHTEKWFAVPGNDGAARVLRWHDVRSCLDEVRQRCVRDWGWVLPCWVSIQSQTDDSPSPFGEIAGRLELDPAGNVVFVFSGASY